MAVILVLYSRKEAVFSSSEDRIRASQASVTVAGRPIAPQRVQKRVPRWVDRVAQSLFAVLFPADCRICNAPLIKVSRLPVCSDCLEQIVPVAGQLCFVCGERLLSPYALPTHDGEVICPICSRVEHSFVRAIAYGSYEGQMRDLVHLLKYAGVRPAAGVLGSMLAEAISARGLFQEGGPDSLPLLVVPVPVHRSKLHDRGFNHAESIARSMIKMAAADGRIQREFVLCEKTLQRTRATRSQTGLTIHQRRENMRGAFAVKRDHPLNGRDVLLIDDVYTTGATVSECARVLRRAGANKVWVATVARTLRLASQSIKLDSGSVEAEYESPLEEATAS